MLLSYKKILGLRLLGIFSAIILLTAPSVASYAVASKSSPFCTNVTKEVNPIISAFNASFSKVLQAQTQQTQSLLTQWQKADQNLANSRQQTDKNINDNFIKLGKKATTAIEAQAVYAYGTDMNKIISTRRSTHDEATATFRSFVKSTINLRQVAIDGQLSIFQAAINAATNKAITSCASNPADGSKIHSIFQTSMATSQTTFKNAIAGDNTFTNRINQLISQSVSTSKTTDDNFQTAQSSMAQTLKSVFGKNSSI
ncbi:MAG TPA: hypothetical protein VMV24_01820 [Candidatus Dormibacteraeota bacterium]|nr:hypothetical protein [Candidatus Dormibacteraeota bacterium]